MFLQIYNKLFLQSQNKLLTVTILDFILFFQIYTYFSLVLTILEHFFLTPCHSRMILFCHSCNPEIVLWFLGVFFASSGLFSYLVLTIPQLFYLSVYFNCQSRMVSLSCSCSSGNIILFIIMLKALE